MSSDVTEPNQKPAEDGRIYISFDGCGTKGYSQMLILHALMHQVRWKENLEDAPRPCDRADIIGGSGMGGIIALLIGRLRMSTSDAIHAYDRLVSEVYCTTRYSLRRTKYDVRLFENSFREIAGVFGYNADSLMEEEDHGQCKTVLFARDAHTKEVQAIRSYKPKKGSEPNPPFTILQAARAVMASPDLFSPVTVGSSSFSAGSSSSSSASSPISASFRTSTPGHQFIAYFHNPTKSILDEAASLFTDGKKIVCLLSLGVGLGPKPSTAASTPTPNPTANPFLSQANDRITSITKIAESCEETHQEVSSLYPDPDIYYRLNVQGEGGENIIDPKLEEWKNMERVKTATNNYLEADEKRFDDIATALMSRGKIPKLLEMPNAKKKRLFQAHVAANPDMVDGINNLALILSNQGDYHKAAELQKMALESSKRIRGSQHPTTMITTNNLATTLSHQGDYAGAIELHKQATESLIHSVGEEHPDTLTSMNNLATNLSYQGRYTEAAQLHSQALEIRKRVLGDEHPDVITSMSNLAHTLSHQKQYAEAAALQQQVVQNGTKVLGETHPDVLTSMSNLALTLSYQGQSAKAAEIQRRVLDLRRQTLGEDHRDTFTAMNNLALSLMNQGKTHYLESEMLFEEAMEGSEKVLGKTHPTTLTFCKNLAVLHRKQGEFLLMEDLLEAYGLTVNDLQ